MSTETAVTLRVALDAIASIAIRGLAFLLVIVILIWGMDRLFGDSLYGFAAAMIGTTKQEVAGLVMQMLTLLKTLALVLYLTPYVAIRWYLKSH